MKNKSICRSCFHSYVCEEFNADRDSNNKKCHYSNDHFVPYDNAVEVVRCKDCRFCKKHPTSDKVNMCTNEQQWVTECYPLVHNDDFCSYGERKETE